MSEREVMDRQTTDTQGTAAHGDPAPTGGDGSGRPSTADIARGGAPAATAATERVDGPDRGNGGATDARGATRGLASTEGERTPLFAAEQAADLRSRWESIQVGFVDEPRSAVEQADGLVAEVMQTLATAFSRERSGLEGQWSKGEGVSTEDLRQTLRRYRSFFDRLLSM